MYPVWAVNMNLIYSMSISTYTLYCVSCLGSKYELNLILTLNNNASGRYKFFQIHESPHNFMTPEIRVRGSNVMKRGAG